MAEVTHQIMIAFAAQGALGTMDTTLDALTTTFVLNDGLVLGATGHGVNDSGVDFSESRILRENPVVAGSWTKQASQFIRAEPTTFSIAFPISGNREDTTGTPVDGDFPHNTGIDALLRCAGLDGAAWGAGVGHDYTPVALSGGQASCVLFVSGMKYSIKDVFAERVEFDLTPGGIGICIMTLTGIISNFVTATFPSSITYGVQQSVSAPSVEEVGNAWDATKPFQSMNIVIDNGLTDFPDSNAEGGSRKRQTQREISFSAGIVADSGDIDFERTKLVGTTAPTEDISMTIGDAASGSDPALAYYILLANVEVRDLTPDIGGDVHLHTLSGICTGTTSGSEFILRFI